MSHLTKHEKKVMMMNLKKLILLFSAVVLLNQAHATNCIAISSTLREFNQTRREIGILTMAQVRKLKLRSHIEGINDQSISELIVSHLKELLHIESDDHDGILDTIERMGILNAKSYKTLEAMIKSAPEYEFNSTNLGILKTESVIGLKIRIEEEETKLALNHQETTTNRLQVGAGVTAGGLIGLSFFDTKLKKLKEIVYNKIENFNSKNKYKINLKWLTSAIVYADIISTYLVADISTDLRNERQELLEVIAELTHIKEYTVEIEGRLESLSILEDILKEASQKLDATDQYESNYSLEEGLSCRKLF